MFKHSGKRARKNLEDTCIDMLNPVSVSFNQIKIPSFGAKNYQTNPIYASGLKTDRFEHSQSAVNISFTSVDDTIIGKSIRELGDVPCPYCGIRVINGKEISHLNKENLGGTSKEAISLLKPFEDRMHPVEKQVFHLLEDLSKKEPKKNLRQLLEKVRPEHLETLKQQEFDIFSRMSNFSSKNFKNKDDAEKIDAFLNEAIDIVQKQDENYIFRRHRFLEKFENTTEKMTDKKTVEGLRKIAEELPRGHDSVSAFIVKFTQKDPKTKQEKTPYQIGISIVEPSVGSLEHIKPRHPQDKSAGGENKYSNYIYASREWNIRRKNTPLDKWVKQNPEIIDNMQKYMDTVIEKINNGEVLKRCRVYPIIVAETLEKESKGLIKLDTSKLKLSKEQIKTERARIEQEEKSKSEKTEKSKKGSSKKKITDTNLNVVA